MAEQKKSKVEALANLEKQRQELEAKIAAERAEALAEIVNTAREAAELIGVSVEELAQAIRKRGAGTRAPAAAKYRNPKNPAETWSGRGKQPAWVAAALKGGAALESLAIGAPASQAKQA